MTGCSTPRLDDDLGREIPDKMLEHPKSLTDYQGKTGQDWAISRSRPTDTQIAYLAGLFDGEGCITISRKHDHRRREAKNPRAKRDYCYSAALFLINTSAAMIAETVRILDGLGVAFNLMHRKPVNAKHRPFYQLSIARLAHIERVLLAITPYMTAKKGEAQLMLRFVGRRMAKNTVQHKSFNPYDDEELAMIDEIVAMKRAESSEAIRQALDERITCRIDK